KIKIDRPNLEGAKDIFGIYLTPHLPFSEETYQQFDGDTQAAAKHFINEAANEMYATTDENRFIEVTYARGERETLFFKDFVSGAMIENIVSRAKKSAIKRFIGSDGTDKGMRLKDLTAAIREEYHENEDLPNTTNPDDWAKISGRKGEKIVNIRALINEPTQEKKQDVRVTRGGTFL
ncbi:MAG: proteasome ATPase, partial [Candidatus Poribacteria bacterium]|nr:proteasome ATPase [Candidatus Poribacteria bacterium]